MLSTTLKSCLNWSIWYDAPMNLYEVISKLSPDLEQSPIINALWLEGSWATGKNNHESDIDVWMDVEDGKFAESIDIFRTALERIGKIDWEDSRGVYSENPKLQKHTFHLEGFPLKQRIELDLQEHSRKFVFNKDEHVIMVIFDKNNSINWNT